MFNELLESVRQGGAILRGEMAPGRTFEFDQLDVKIIREQLNLSQSQFAALLEISIETLRDWEQGRLKPEGPVRVLLRIAAKYPEVVLEVAQA